MIKGIGIDIVEIARIKEIVTRQPLFVERILTESEYDRYQLLQGKRQVEFLAGRFAAKEAFVKAAGTGISKKYSWHDIYIENEESGNPIISVKEVEDRLHISISHSDEYAVAQVIIESL